MFHLLQDSSYDKHDRDSLPPGAAGPAGVPGRWRTFCWTSGRHKHVYIVSSPRLDPSWSGWPCKTSRWCFPSSSRCPCYGLDLDAEPDEDVLRGITPASHGAGPDSMTVGTEHDLRKVHATSRAVHAVARSLRCENPIGAWRPYRRARPSARSVSTSIQKI